MAIQHRRGIYDRFDPSRLVAGEWAIVLSGDTSASDGRAAYICFAAGTVKRIATYEDMAESIANANEELIEELTAQITAATTAANTAASNANTKATAANTAASSANTAASAANTAASNANSKATAANTAASSANSAASSATTAAGRANTAADAANAAATSATEAAESVSDAAYRAETAATSANTAAGSANAAAQRANTAADSANAATSEANAAIEAMGDISELAVPEMTASVRGGAKVGGSTQVVGEKLEIKLSESATGTSVTTGSTSALRELQVHGKSVQDGTPTPDAPVPVQVVEGRNLLPNISSTNRTHNGVAFSINTNRIAASGTSTAMAESNLITLDAPVTLEAGKQYTISLSGKYSVSGSSTLLVFYDESSTAMFNSGSQSNGVWTFTPNATMNLKYMRFRVNTAGATVSVDANIQLEEGSTATPYVPYGSIGIDIGGTVVPIDLQGNVLASLPDGTQDELHVDSTGHCVLTKNVGKYTFNGSENWSLSGGAKRINNNNLRALIPKAPDNYTVIQTMCNRFTPQTASQTYSGTVGVSIDTTGSVGFANGSTIDVNAWKSWLESNNVVLMYPFATSQTIELGYIDPPAIPSGSVVTVSASLTPTFELACWTEHASELADIPDAITTLAEVIYDKQESVASSIAPVEGSTASANHAVGDYLMLGARLYRVTTAIASGERIIPGTNVTETTVMAEIVSLLS